MKTYRISKWPFEKDVAASVYWVTSPIVNQRSGAKWCKAFFQEEGADVPTAVPVAWGLLTELWIGRRFINGTPVMDEAQTTSSGELVTFVMDPMEVECEEIKEAALAIPTKLYSLYKKRELCSEYCVTFRYRGRLCILPCVELVRALYAHESQLANQLMSDGGLDEMIVPSSWRVEDGTAYFDFSERFQNKGSKYFPAEVAVLYGVPELKKGWDSVYVRCVEKKRIYARIPKLAGLRLQCTGICKGNHILITCMESLRIPAPFSKIEYGPAALKRTEELKQKEGTILEEDMPDVAEFADATAAARYGRESSVQGGKAAPKFLEGMEVSRKKEEGGSKTNKHRMKTGATDRNYTPNDQTGLGTETFLNIVPKELIEVESDPDFAEFCEALNHLGGMPFVSGVEISYNILPGSKSFSYIGRSPRKYAVATVMMGNRPWRLMELCLKDGYSISTLLIQSGRDAQELANQMVDKLLEANGHWTSEVISVNIAYRTLDHRKGRTAQRWAELLYKKMG